MESYLSAEELRKVTTRAIEKANKEKLERVISTDTFVNIMNGMKDAAKEGKHEYQVGVHNYKYYQDIVDNDKLVKDFETMFSDEYNDVFDVLQNQLGFKVVKTSIRNILVKKNDPNYSQQIGVETAMIYW